MVDGGLVARSLCEQKVVQIQVFSLSAGGATCSKFSCGVTSVSYGHMLVSDGKR